MLQQRLLEHGSAVVVRATYKNRMLAALPNETLLSLEPHLKPICLSRGLVLCEAASSGSVVTMVRGRVSVGVDCAEPAAVRHAQASTRSVTHRGRGARPLDVMVEKDHSP
jgi:hypothetical protein